MTTTVTEARDAVFQELFEIASRDRDVILFTVDTGAFLFRKFKESLPDQFFNLGIAEQNAISVSAGLALAGKKPFVFGITNFVTLRCLEQIKIDICCMELPVTIIGMGTGYVYPKDGPTHHMTDILSVARTLPALTIWSPSDYAMIAGVTRLAYTSGAPNLIYMDKGPFTPLYEADHDFSKGISILSRGSDLTIVSTGIMTPQALLAVKRLKKMGIDAGLIDLYRIKPIDKALVLETLVGAKRILTLEENTLAGGLGSLICEIVAETGSSARIKRLGIPDTYHCEIGDRDDLRAMDGLDLESVVRAACALIGRNVKAHSHQGGPI